RLRVLHRVAGWSLRDVLPLSVDANGARLLAEVERVAIDPLEQAAAHAAEQVIGGETPALELRGEAAQAGGRDAGTLHDADEGRQHPVALAVRLVAEVLHQPLDRLRRDLDGVAGVAPHTDQTREVPDLLPQLLAEDVADGVLVIERVAEQPGDASILV